MMRGVRGATTVINNIEQEIVANTEELLLAMIESNGITPESVCSVIVSSTEDLTAAFPAKAVRSLEGWNYVPVMNVREIAVPDALEKCVRVMLHWNTEKEQQQIEHVYLREAVVLRPDLNSK
ncbi:MAG: chorismate mutase [Bacillus sp. (in: firmicutes)]